MDHTPMDLRIPPHIIYYEQLDFIFLIEVSGHPGLSSQNISNSQTVLVPRQIYLTIYLHWSTFDLCTV